MMKMNTQSRDVLGSQKEQMAGEKGSSPLKT